MFNDLRRQTWNTILLEGSIKLLSTQFWKESNLTRFNVIDMFNVIETFTVLLIQSRQHRD